MLSCAVCFCIPHIVFIRRNVIFYYPYEILLGELFLTPKNRRYNSIFIGFITLVIVALTVVLVLNFIRYTNRFAFSSDDTPYDRYYVMITDNPKSSFWQSVYKSALEAARESNDCLEMISDNLSRDYSVYELMEIATISGVDGIIVSADESEEMTELIDRAAANGIQVVTLYNDNSASSRLSYVGVSNYNLGKQYGELILKIAQEKKFTEDKIEVVIFADVNSADAAQNLMFTAVQETVDSENPEKRSIHPPIELTIYGVDTTSELSVEESIKTFLLKDRESLPEIVVCLNEMDTVAAYQTVVDYNEVGLVDILGYYDSEVILNGIERNVIYATISTDTEQMGRYSVNALTEYFEYGYTSQYFTSDISVITKDNVAQYMEEYEDEN